MKALRIRFFISLHLLLPAFTHAEPNQIPPHLPKALVGLHAYSEKSIAAGDTLHVRVSSTQPYELSICRLGPNLDAPTSDTILKTFPEAPPVFQPIHPGSYVHVEDGLAAGEPLAALTLECWVRPWRVDTDQGLLTQYDYPRSCGLGLFLGVDGCIRFYAGDGKRFADSNWHTASTVVTNRQWSHIVGTWDGATKALWINGHKVGEWPWAGPLDPGSAPLRLGAFGHAGVASRFLDGDLAMPAVYERALSPEEIVAHYEDRGLTTPGPAANLRACWPLSEERGDSVADVSGEARSGRIVNHATWMIGGPSFDSASVPLYGPYDPETDPTRGHGLRFASDDLFDCRWETTHEFEIPETARSGIYVARFRFDSGGKPCVYDHTFVVRKASDRPPAPLLVLASSDTWLCYNSSPFCENGQDPLEFWGTDGMPSSPGDPPSFSCYKNHAAGQPTYYLGLNMPWPTTQPYNLYSSAEVGYGHLLRAERPLLNWLEAEGYAYDMEGGVDLERQPNLLLDYEAVVINGHSEYWSPNAYLMLDRYLRQGGDVIVLSGNTLFWRVSWNAEGTVMECRKIGDHLGGRAFATVGETWNHQDRQRGSLMRNCGFPAWQLIGLECVGWWGSAPEDFGVYRVEQPEHFLFTTPERIDLASGDALGAAPGGGLPRAVGHECDVRLSTLLEMTPDAPSGATMPGPEPAGIVTLARSAREGAAIDYFTRPAQHPEKTVSEIVYWERPSGGRVFAAGSVGAGWGLTVDPKAQALLRNVLHHFGVSAP